MAISKGKGYDVNGLHKARKSDVNLATLTERDRNILSTLVKAGHTKGFIDKELDGERYTWEVVFKKFR